MDISQSPIASPDQRPHHNPHLTARDLAVLEVFRDVRFVETSMFSAFLTPDPFPTHQRLRLRLPRLEKLGLITRPARRILATRNQPFRLAWEKVPRGRPEDVWALAQPGAAVLRLQGDWNKNNHRLSGSAFSHPLMTAGVYTTIRAAAARGLIDLEMWLGDKAFRDRIVAHGREFPIVPDATFKIRDVQTGMSAAVFLEVDNATEPLTRTDFRQSHFLKKCVGYWHYWGRVLRRSTPERMLVLTVAKTPAWADALRRTAARVDAAGRGINLFWFTNEQQWDVTTPERFLYDPIWTTAAGEVSVLFHSDLSTAHR